MRAGFAAMPVLACLMLASIWLAVIAGDAAQRQRAHLRRLAAVQAEEHALGLRCFPPGTVLSIGGWTLRRENSVAEVADARGRLRLHDDGTGVWEPAP
jgi:hypothetical protein